MRAFDLACDRPWAITEDSLQTILSIAARENLDPFAVAAELGRPLDNTHAVTNRDGVAVIPVDGPIFRKANLFTAVSGATSVEMLATDLTAALADPAIRAILLDIDSPGGEANGIHELSQMIYAARSEKPITAYVGGAGCSAAYWLASACDEIVADATSLLGSIGAIMAVTDPGKKSAKDVLFVSSQSPLKATDPKTEAGASEAQRIVDALASVFIADVARNRDVPVEIVTGDYGKGSVLVGQHAVDMGLADRLGSFEGTIAALQQRASVRAASAPSAVAVTTEKGNPVQLKDVFTSFFAGAKEAGIEIEAPVPAATAMTSPAATPPSAPQPDPEKELLKQQLAQLRAQQIADRAASFAAEQIAASKALPAQRDALIAAYSVAAADDAEYGQATFGAGKTSRVDALAALFTNAPTHALTQQLVPVVNGTVTAGNLMQTAGMDGEKPKPMSPDRMAELLGKTPQGQMALRDIVAKK